ncbi:hypothetical protein SAMN05216582_11827 [Selenomonas ruminantium]|uniref:Molybdenum cofactor biosynthesis protein F N-terminal domain-containing protein n=1 Tax=Selenomonas ruminantium TaxID=971 RepID=A0A1M6VEP0_SELRU|nr:MoaF N-terminal domain-containing protein [Selenomonas ruminantium]SHK79918.1 hypothetical protein SAMN05216582_11827 [Selenomonas ruminantium]
MQIEGYTLVSPRKGIYLLDYIESHVKALSVTFVLDMNRRMGTIMRAQLPAREEADISQLVRAKENMTMAR